MTAKKKTIAEINEKLKKGEAVVMTAMEFKKEVRRGYKFKIADVDVVTTGTRACMSGTSAMVVIPVAEKGAFERAEEIWLNSVLCLPGSNPEPGSGMVDTVIYGTEDSHDFEGKYGGGHLLRDIVKGKEIQVECITNNGQIIHSTFTLDQLKFARIYSFRNGFQNYHAYANIKNHPSYREHPLSIFAPRKLPVLGALCMSGSGELNPLDNDPHTRVLRAGWKILVNNAPGIIIGYGTRSYPNMRALSLAADMFGMDPQFMGGFKTSGGLEVTQGIAVPLPILNQEIIDDISHCLDEKLPLRIGDIGDRIDLAEVKYSDIWTDAKLEIEFDFDRCISCSFQCAAEYYCPMGAISWKEKEIDETLCFGCGACTANCLGGAFMGKGDVPKGRIGLVRALGTNLPVIFRQSDRFRAELLATNLKELMEKGEFILNETDFELRLWNV